jgi:hypothetical protein
VVVRGRGAKEPRFGLPRQRSSLVQANGICGSQGWLPRDPVEGVASIILGFGWGFVAGILAGPLPLGARLIVLPCGYVVGLILGTLGRAEVADSDRLGKILAIVGIGLNAFGLITGIYSLIPFGLVRGVG